MVNELQEKYFKYKTTMYNAIMAGYFFEKNISGGLRVLKQMRDANIKLDSYTFSYLIGNCATKEEIKKYYEEMEQSGIHLTKEVFVSLIHAYAACGEFDAEKQDVLCNLHGELERVLLLLKELSGQDWVDGFSWAIRYSVQNKNLSSTIQLFKQLKEYYKNDAFKRGDPFYLKRKGHDFFDEAYFLILKYGSTYLQFGMDLLDLIKKELGLVPSKMCLDGLLTLCAISRDLNNAHLI
ncbi:pentatricopeptide repeat-containing protein At4g04790, mitochondrial-like [Medicago truncatula]|uniref:pentatricopeptide repeat-containing protein At4g04790, mitochondrial-like n=1 Tax=Medicago truncatula TaxID=3880 RepID=UPI0019676067|nr:pentatricopeptide repeat-containing protein At4g04790, mitochondrial-like [Medicago truncatula]